MSLTALVIGNALATETKTETVTVAEIIRACMGQRRNINRNARK